MTYTVSQLRALLENIPGDTIVVTEYGDHEFRNVFEVHYTTVLEHADENGIYTEDIFIPEAGEGIGEHTEYGIRVKAVTIF